MSLHAIEPQQLRRQRRVLAWNLHAIEQTQSRGRRRVDGVGRLRLISTQVQLRRTHGVQAEAAPIGDVRPGFLPAVLASCRPLVPARHCVEIKAHGAFVLNCRVVLHAIDATPARWRGDAGSSPLDRAMVHPTHWLISTQVRHGQRPRRSERAPHRADGGWITLPRGQASERLSVTVPGRGPKLADRALR